MSEVPKGVGGEKKEEPPFDLRPVRSKTYLFTQYRWV